jgi:hypothetical protein
MAVHIIKIYDTLIDTGLEIVGLPLFAPTADSGANRASEAGLQAPPRKKTRHTPPTAHPPTHPPTPSTRTPPAARPRAGVEGLGGAEEEEEEEEQEVGSVAYAFVMTVLNLLDLLVYKYEYSRKSR